MEYTHTQQDNMLSVQFAVNPYSSEYPMAIEAAKQALAACGYYLSRQHAVAPEDAQVAAAARNALAPPLVRQNAITEEELRAILDIAMPVG
jgi:hypothetical protein